MVALRPPRIVYAETLRGSSQRLAYTLIPVSELIAAAPPIKMDETTKIFEAKLKNMKEKCAVVPYLTRIISRNVRALGAFLLACFETSDSIESNVFSSEGQTYNSQVTENHDLSTVTRCIEERSSNAVLISNSGR